MTYLELKDHVDKLKKNLKFDPAREGLNQLQRAQAELNFRLNLNELRESAD